MSGKIPILFLLFAMLIIPSTARSEDLTDINLPEGYKIEKKTDLSAALLSRLFGATWHEIIGDNATESDVAKAASGSSVQNARGGLGQYSGLIVSILGVLNLAAMAYVAVAIIYMWGIFAVTTAHEGNKLGGSLYNSLWVPVRHACSFSLTVPILNGLSLMQVAIMACVGLSINFANKIWDASGAYIVEHAHVGIVDSSAPMLETEAYAVIPIMFGDSVIAMVEANADNTQDRSGVKYNRNTQYIEAFQIGQTPDGQMLEGYIKYDYAQGFALMSIVPPKGMDAANFGNIQFSIPKRDCREVDGKFICSEPTGSDRSSYDLKKKISDARIDESIALWRGVNAIAAEYLKSDASGGGKTCVYPEGSGNQATCEPRPSAGDVADRVDQMVHDYMLEVTRKTESLAMTIVNSRDGESIKQALGQAIDSKNGESRYGWVSAGLFTFSLASLQQKIDDEIMTRISARYPRGVEKLGNDRRWFFGILGDYELRNYTSAQKAALDNMDGFIARDLLGNQRYGAAEAAQTDSDSVLHDMGVHILSSFVSDGSMVSNSASGRSAGILSTVLNEFGTYDPIVVMSSFGNRLLGVVNWATAGGAILTAALGSIIVIGALAACIIAGAVFAYVVPITPVVFWMKALLTWLYLVVEVMVAAPFWCCSHALPEGAGFAGQHAKRGYLMMLDIVIRPTLLVIGAVFAVAIIQCCGWLFNVLFNSWFANITGTFIQIGLVADIAFSIVVMSTMYYVSYTVFTKGVNYLPEKVVQWCGGMGGSGLRDEEHGTAQILAAGGMAGMAQRGIGNGGQELGRTARAGLTYGAKGLGRGVDAARAKMADALNRRAGSRSQIGDIVAAD